MLLHLVAVALASEAWIAEPEPWGDARILAVYEDDRLHVLTERGLFVGGVRDPDFALKPANHWDFARGGHPVAADVDGMCAWVDSDWTCLEAVEHFPRQFHPDWAGALRGVLWRWNGSGWDHVESPLPDTLSSHVKQISAASEGVWLIPILGDWWHFDGATWDSHMAPPVDKQVAAMAMCGDLAVHQGVWLRTDSGWKTVAGGEDAVTCQGDLVGGTQGRLWRWDGEVLHPIPTTSAADIHRITESRVWAGADLLFRSELGIAFRDEAILRGVADQAPTESAWFVDADGAGPLDLLTALEGGGLVLHLNDDGQFRDGTLGSGLEAMRWTDAVLDECDLDGDGRMDLVVGENLGIRWLRGREFGWEEVTDRGVDDPFIGRRIHDVDCVDLDGDGDLDLHLTTGMAERDSFPAPASGFQNVGHGLLRRADPALRGLAVGMDWQFRTVFADLGGDGVDEAIVVNSWAGGPAVYARKPDGTWRLDLRLDGSMGLYRAALVGDWDADGRPDVALLRDSGTRLQRNDGDIFHTLPLPDIEAPLPVPFAANREWVDPGGLVDDVDGDGDLDLITLAADGARWMRNLGEMRFDVPSEDVGLRRGTAQQVIASDIDGDGDLDAFLPTLDGANQLLVNAGKGPGAAALVRPEASGPMATVTRRIAWLRWEETAPRLALVTLALLWVLAAARRRDTVALSRIPVAVLLLVAAVFAELWASEASAALRWAVGLGALGSLAVLARVDRFATQLLRATRLAGYKLEGILGSGGMGTVHLARDGSQLIALKVLHPELAEQPDARSRFRREAELASRFQHDNLVRILASGECRVFRGDLPQRSLYLAMEYVDGPVLSSLMGKPLPLGQACRLIVDLLGVLTLLHDGDIVHRDVKPSNLLITADGTLKLADFGIAHGQASRSLTRTGHVLGTLAYMAPEQARGGEIDARVDLYSVGVLAYELLSGEPPFDADDGVDLVYQLLMVEPPRVRGVHATVADAVDRCLAKDPDERWADAQSLRAVLLPFADERVDLKLIRAGSTLPDEETGAQDQTRTHA